MAQLDGRGILYPARLPSFHREDAPEELRELVRWFWIPRWQLAPGRVSRQELLPFAASNLVVQPEGITVSGPSTRVTHRDLRGSGWAVGALLRPAGAAALQLDVLALRDAEAGFDDRELHTAVARAMEDSDERVGRERAVAAFGEWLGQRVDEPDENALLANDMEDAIASDRKIVRVEQLAKRLSTSARSVQRLARRYIGLPPLAVIRRYRLQEAAERLRADPGLTVATIAAELGYADHAHLAADFRRVLGVSPNSYRSASSS